MDPAGLGDRLRPDCADRVRQALEPVTDDHAHVLDAAVLDLGPGARHQRAGGRAGRHPSGRPGEQSGAPGRRRVRRLVRPLSRRPVPGPFRETGRGPFGTSRNRRLPCATRTVSSVSNSRTQSCPTAPGFRALPLTFPHNGHGPPRCSMLTRTSEDRHVTQCPPPGSKSRQAQTARSDRGRSAPRMSRQPTTTLGMYAR